MKDIHIKFNPTERRFIAENGYIPLSILMGKLPETAKTKVSFNGGFSTKEELWAFFAKEFVEKGVEIKDLLSFLQKMGDHQINVFENILDELYRLCEKHGSQIFNSILEAAKLWDPSKCNVRYFSVTITNQAKAAKPQEQANLNPVNPKIRPEKVNMENVGNYVKQLKHTDRIRLWEMCEKSFNTYPDRNQFRLAVKAWREKGWSNDFTGGYGKNPRRVVVDVIGAAVAAKNGGKR